MQLFQIKSLANDTTSGIVSVQSDYTILIQPKYINNISEGIKNSLNSLIGRYIEKFNGIIMAYDLVQLKNCVGNMFAANPIVYLPIAARFFVFRFKIGDVLRGTVVKRSNTHIGCIVNDVLNVSVVAPSSRLTEEIDPQENEEVKLIITYVCVRGRTPYVKGDIDTISSYTESDHILAVDAINDDSGISCNDKSTDETDVKRKKKKRVSNLLLSDICKKSSIEDDSNLEETVISYSGKKHKKKEKEFISNGLDLEKMPELDILDAEIEHSKSAKKRRKSKTADQSFTDGDQMPTKKKSKRSL